MSEAPAQSNGAGGDSAVKIAPDESPATAAATKPADEAAIPTKSLLGILREGGLVLALQLIDQHRDALNGMNSADALAGTPDVLPRLGGRVA